MLILENFKLIRKLYDKNSKNFFSLPDNKICTNSPAKFLIPSFFKRFSKLKILLDQVWKQISRDLLLIYIKFELSSQIYIKTKNLTSTQKSAIFFLITYQKFNIFELYSKQLLVFFCDCFCEFFQLFERFKDLKGSTDWIHQLGHDWTHFLNKNSIKES